MSGPRQNIAAAAAFVLLLGPRVAIAGCDRAPARAPAPRGARPQVITVRQYEDGGASRACPVQPQSTCETPGSVRLVVRNSLDSTKDSLVWKWRRGDAFEQADIGNPAGKAKYALCLYDSIESARVLSASLVVEPGRGWTRDEAKGWQYKDPRGKSSGVTGLLLKSGEMGKTRVRLAASGPELPLPPPASGSQFFHKDGSVVVQLVTSTSGQCWTSTFMTAKENNAASFVAP